MRAAPGQRFVFVRPGHGAGVCAVMDVTRVAAVVRAMLLCIAHQMALFGQEPPLDANPPERQEPGVSLADPRVVELQTRRRRRAQEGRHPGFWQGLLAGSALLGAKKADTQAFGRWSALLGGCGGHFGDGGNASARPPWRRLCEQSVRHTCVGTPSAVNRAGAERTRGLLRVEDLPQRAISALREDGAGGSDTFQMARFHPLGHLGQRLR